MEKIKKSQDYHCLTILLLIMNFTVNAEVILDGSLGSSAQVNGPDYNISSDMGKQEGANLFHSFSQFNINQGENATFTGPASISNIISRVTGGENSLIDGSLGSDIAGANLYLINPAGIMFGPNASLNVDGSFHATTADYVSLGDEGRFDAQQSSNTILSSAVPSAFGFVNNESGNISVQADEFDVKVGETISLIGGDIEIGNGAAIRAPSGRVDIASVTSIGEVKALADDLDTSSFDTLGEISIKGGVIDTSGNPGGSVYIRGGRFVIDQRSLSFSENVATYSGITSATLGEKNHTGKAIDIRVTGEMAVTGAELSGSSLGTGDGGDVFIQADSLKLHGGVDSEETPIGVSSVIAARVFSEGDGGNITIEANEILLESHTYIAAQIFGSGNGGNISINTDTLNIDSNIAASTYGYSFISTSTFNEGDAGDLTVNANSIKLIRGDYYTGFASQSQNSGSAGDIKINTGKLELIDGAQINSAVFSELGSAGNIEIFADEVVLVGRGGFGASGIFSNVDNTESEVDGGNIIVNSNSINIAEGAEIGSFNNAKGKAGDITIATEILKIASMGHVSASAGKDSSGSGIIQINAKSIDVLDGAQVSTSTKGLGDAGKIEVNAENITLSGTGITGRNASVVSNSIEDATGNAGEIFISATDMLSMGDRGAILVTSETTGQGGNINIEAANLSVTDGAFITASALGSGDGGNVNLKSNHIHISGVHEESYEHPLFEESLYQSSIVSQAGINGGNAGNIDIETGSLEVSDGGIISTETFGAGNAGSINISADEAIVSGENSNHVDFLQGKGNSLALATKIARSSITSGTSIELIGSSDTGKGGSIILDIKELQVSKLGILSTGTDSTADGGSLVINSDSIELSENGLITASSTGTGEAGNLTITSNTLESQNSTIETRAASSDGGNIEINSTGLLHFTDSEVTAEVGSADGKGGNVTFAANPELVVLGNTKITANAFNGPGGNVLLSAKNIITSPDSEISASSVSNVDGEIVIDAPEVDLSASLTPLADRAVNAATVVQQPCKERSQADAIRLVQQHYRVLPGSPASLNAPLAKVVIDENEQSFSLVKNTINHPRKPAVAMVLCHGDVPFNHNKKS